MYYYKGNCVSFSPCFSITLYILLTFLCPAIYLFTIEICVRGFYANMSGCLLETHMMALSVLTVSFELTSNRNMGK